MRLATAFVEKELAGISSLDISFKTLDNKAFNQPETLQVVEKFQNHVNQINGVDTTLSLSIL